MDFGSCLLSTYQTVFLNRRSDHSVEPKEPIETGDSKEHDCRASPASRLLVVPAIPLGTEEIVADIEEWSVVDTFEQASADLDEEVQKLHLEESNRSD